MTTNKKTKRKSWRWGGRMGSRRGRLDSTDFKALLDLHSYCSPPGLLPYCTPLDLLALLLTPPRSSKISEKFTSQDFRTFPGSLFSLLFICSLLLTSGHCSNDTTPDICFPWTSVSHSWLTLTWSLFPFISSNFLPRLYHHLTH